MNLLQRFRLLFALAGAVAALSAPPVQAELAGAYLAARSADRASDYTASRDYLTRALVEDPANPILVEGLMNALVGLGDVAGALPVARRLQALGEQSQIAAIVLLSERVFKEDYASLLKDLSSDTPVAGPLIDQLVAAWAHLGTGSMAQALEAFDTLAKTQGVSAFGNYHKALALGMVGDFEGADALFKDPDNGLMALRRSVIAHMQVLSQLDRPQDALAKLNEAFGSEPDPEFDALRAKLTAQAAGDQDAKLPFTTVRTVRDGVADVFYVLAAVLQSEAAPQQTLIHTRMVEYLRPDHIDGILLSAALLESLGQQDLAIAAYDSVPLTDPAHIAAETGKVQALYRLGRKEEALTAMKALAERESGFLTVHIGYGDLLRREERHAEAAAAYGRAIDLIETPDRKDWALFYSRGIAFEQAKDWERAEPDFRKALELYPDQPDALNYLGYSLLDRNQRIDEALGMIERAVELYPESGHIIDSLAWGYFLTGRYAEALQQMEKASMILPVDPIVTDHLADVYWAVGRQNEARFQWRRALSFKPTDKEAELIRRKLEVGLDQVLTEEGLPALADRGKK